MFRKLSSLFVLTALAFVAGCGDDDNPVHSHEEEHAEAFGFVMLNSGVPIVTQSEGTLEGEVDVGLEKETPLLQIRFLNEEGERFTPHTEDGYSLGWEEADTSIAKVDWHEGDGDWAFHIVGEGVGKTTITIKINHGGHSDFVSLPFEIHVTEDGPGEEHGHEDE